MSNYHFGDDYDLNYYPCEASDGMGGVDWDKVERVEIECDMYVKERTCELVPFDGQTVFGKCSECHSWIHGKMNYCSNCGARVNPKNSETTPKVVSE